MLLLVWCMIAVTQALNGPAKRYHRLSEESTMTAAEAWAFAGFALLIFGVLGLLRRLLTSPEPKELNEPKDLKELNERKEQVCSSIAEEEPEASATSTSGSPLASRGVLGKRSASKKLSK